MRSVGERLEYLTEATAQVRWAAFLMRSSKACVRIFEAEGPKLLDLLNVSAD